MSQRADRVGHLLQRELSTLLRELKDPRVQAATLVTVTAVRVSEDLGMARVLVSIVDEEPVRVLRAVGHAQRFLHGQIARRLQLRKVPELRFELDDTEARAGHIEELLRGVRAEPPVGPGSDPAVSPAPQADGPPSAPAGGDDEAPR